MQKTKCQIFFSFHSSSSFPNFNSSVILSDPGPNQPGTAKPAHVSLIWSRNFEADLWTGFLTWICLACICNWTLEKIEKLKIWSRISFSSLSLKGKKRFNFFEISYSLDQLLTHFLTVSLANKNFWTGTPFPFELLNKLHHFIVRDV